MASNRLSRRALIQWLTALTASLPLSRTNATKNLYKLIDDPRPVFIPPGAGEKGKIGDTDIVFKLDKSQTSGNLGSAETTLYPGMLGAPPHFHRGFDEICIVREGTVHIMVGDEVFEVPAGGWHLRPRGVVHTFWNSGTVPAKFIELYAPGGHEAYMKALTHLFDNGRRPTRDDLAHLAEKYDIVWAFDRLPAIMEKFKVHL